jgi:hypothetical protein
VCSEIPDVLTRPRLNRTGLWLTRPIWVSDDYLGDAVSVYISISEGRVALQPEFTQLSECPI